jgi:hypothetical protein
VWRGEKLDEQGAGHHPLFGNLVQGLQLLFRVVVELKEQEGNLSLKTDDSN